MARGSPARATRSMAGPPGIAEAEQLGDLVEGLARRVVARLADALVAPRRSRAR